MTDDMEADIVLQLDALAKYAERANHWTDDMRLMDASGVADTVYCAIDRIEELEEKLAKAIEAIKKMQVSSDAMMLHVARTTLAELTKRLK